MSWALTENPDGFTRARIVNIHDSDPVVEERRRLIAGLMWGYGQTGLRYPRGVPSVVSMLSDPGLTERLRVCRQRVEANDVAGAYNGLTGIPGIRSSFFTKHLYFTGRHLNPAGEFPLILDTMVRGPWHRSRALTVCRFASFWPVDDAESYARYVRAMHRWAGHIDRSADVIEFYLWQPDDGFHEACERAYDEWS